MELTISNLIKIIIAVIVIIVIVIAAYFVMKNYMIPYFKGISFEMANILINK